MAANFSLENWSKKHHIAILIGSYPAADGMNNKAHEQQSEIKALISKGLEQGYLTYAEINDHLPDDIVDPEQIEDIMAVLKGVGIDVHDAAPDADPLADNAPGATTDDETAAEEAVALLSAVDSEVGRTTDPCACTCAKWARWNCSPAKAKSPSPSASKKALPRCRPPWPASR